MIVPFLDRVIVGIYVGHQDQDNDCRVDGNSFQLPNELVISLLFAEFSHPKVEAFTSLGIPQGQGEG